MGIENNHTEPKTFGKRNSSEYSRILLLEDIVMWTVVIVLLVLWALGFGFAGSTLGWLVHLLLVVAVIVAIVNLLRGRNTV